MKVKFLVLAGLLLAANALTAQDTAESKKPTLNENIAKVRSAFTSDYLQVSGFGQVIANYSQFPERQGFTKMQSQSSFDLARLILLAKGKLGKQNQFGYMIMFDLGPNTALHELYGEWTPIDAVNLRFGQFKVPFTLENPMAPSLIETVYFSRSASAMCGSAGDFNQFEPDGSVKVKVGRDAGFQISGKFFKNEKANFHFLQYYLGIFNGTGMNAKDNNNSKDFVGTLYAQPIQSLKLGGSVYSGKLKYGFNGAEPTDQIRNRWAAGGEFSSKYFYARSEYIAAKDGNIKREGAYASLVGKFLPDKFEALAKYDYYNSGTQTTHDITAGVNYYLARNTRLQFNYIYTKYADSPMQNHAAAMQLQVFF